MTKSVAHVWIHGWSLAHGITAGATSQTLDGGELILTVETIVAVGSFSKLCGAKWSRTFIETFVKQQLAQRLGIKLANLTVGKAPIVGNIFNGISSTAITEAILWETFYICQNKSVA